MASQGQVDREPDDWIHGFRRTDGVSTDQASEVNCGTPRQRCLRERHKGHKPEAENTDALSGFGAPHTSEEGLVMRLEQRGCVITGSLKATERKEGEICQERMRFRSNDLSKLGIW